MHSFPRGGDNEAVQGCTGGAEGCRPWWDSLCRFAIASAFDVRDSVDALPLIILLHRIFRTLRHLWRGCGGGIVELLRRG